MMYALVEPIIINVENLDDLIKAGLNNKYTKGAVIDGEFYCYGRGYSLNLEKIGKLYKPLTKLKNLIGLSEIKQQIFEIIMFYLQGLDDDSVKHTIIQGPSGVGKTELAKILGEIYCALEITGNKFIKATRTDLIGGYLGQTAIKTQKVIDSALGGVLFIDEAYSLGGDKDSYSSECINILNENLTKHKDKLICIISGYKDALDNEFFSQNRGLRRRFKFTLNIDKYSGIELYDILLGKIIKSGWKINGRDKVKTLITDNKKLFKYYGGDMELLLNDIKIIHSTRMIKKHPMMKKIIIVKDVEKAINKLKKERKEKRLSYYI